MHSPFEYLGEELKKVASSLEFAQPKLIQHEGRNYWSLTQTGEVHGLDTLCAFDELNNEFLLWDGNSPYTDWCSSALEEAELHNGVSFETIGELIYRLYNPQD